MKVKKYKRVKRPKVYVEPAESVGEGRKSSAKDQGNNTVTSCERPEEDNDGDNDDDDITIEREREGGADMDRAAESVDQKQRREGESSTNGRRKFGSDGQFSNAAAQESSPDLTNHTGGIVGSHGSSRTCSCLVSSEQEISSANAQNVVVVSKSNNGCTRTGEAAAALKVCPGDAAGAAAASDNTSKNPTPRATTCSDVGNGAPPSVHNGERNKGDDVDEASRASNFESEEDSEPNDDDNTDEVDGGGENISETLGPGSHWFQAERVAYSLQLLALALDVDGAVWPPLFSTMWGWTWFTTEYLRWPMLVLLRRVGRAFSLSFGDAGHDLWLFRDPVGYGVEVCSTGLVAFVLFFVLQMPDYTSHKPQTAWRRRFLTHWFRSSLPRYLFNLCLFFAGFAGLVLYGATCFSADVVTAVTVVGGCVVTVSWFLLVLLSFLVHMNLRLATKHDAEYSFMIAMVRVEQVQEQARQRQPLP